MKFSELENENFCTELSDLAMTCIHQKDTHYKILCSMLCEDDKVAVAVSSKLQQQAKLMYGSNPLAHG